jgi:hypothetical protein
MLDQRDTTQRMKHFGDAGTHPRAFASRQHYRSRWLHTRRGVVIILVRHHLYYKKSDQAHGEYLTASPRADRRY